MGSANTIFATLFIVVFASASTINHCKIVGGDVARIGQFPFHVSLRVNDEHKCGGSIISNRWILTAAHCVLFPKEYMKIVTGSVNLNGASTISLVKKISSLGFVGELPLQYDIALIELEKPLEFKEGRITAIKLAHEEIPDNAEIVILGFGRVFEGGPISSVLKFNKNVKKMNSAMCKALNQDNYYNGLLCLKHSDGNGACQGDSGGGAIYNNELVGLSSFTKGGCGKSNFPDGYTKISYFIDWINEETGLSL